MSDNLPANLFESRRPRSSPRRRPLTRPAAWSPRPNPWALAIMLSEMRHEPSLRQGGTVLALALVFSAAVADLAVHGAFVSLRQAFPLPRP